MSNEDTTVRLATLLSAAMNLVALIDDASALHAVGYKELRSTLLWFVDEIEWAHSIAGAIQGLVWPADVQARNASLRAEAGAWDAQASPSATLLDAVRGCLSVFQPSAG
jgi:hypothetical protein